MKNAELLAPFQVGHLQLQNRIAMAPMTRSRAVGTVPNDLMVKYYALRAEAGLIITEGTAPSINGMGYPNIPGVYSEEQVAGWKKITDAVHEKGGKIFLQIMHVGRVAHILNIPEGGEVIAPSAVVAPGEMFTFEGPKPHTTPREMTKADIEQVQAEYVQAAQNAIAAGFDGIEIHAANGYLPNQFLNTGTNQRADEYGGSVENRSRFVLELTEKIVAAIGADKTGIRLSPYGVFNGLNVYDDIPATYEYLMTQLSTFNLAYLHFANLSQLSGQPIPERFLENLAQQFNGPVIFNGGFGFDLERAANLLAEDDKYLVSIGVPFISNPDLIERIRTGAPYNDVDQNTFYTPGEEGYLTYPTLAEATA